MVFEMNEMVANGYGGAKASGEVEVEGQDAMITDRAAFMSQLANFKVDVKS